MNSWLNKPIRQRQWDQWISQDSENGLVPLNIIHAKDLKHERTCEKKAGEAVFGGAVLCVLSVSSAVCLCFFCLVLHLSISGVSEEYNVLWRTMPLESTVYILCLGNPERFGRQPEKKRTPYTSKNRREQLDIESR